ncbi:MAG: hypothetical protein H7A24_06190 [Leptospiraceae bacterium]|nr:hypothetical protein [Leptospiraceae bacterium]
MVEAIKKRIELKDFAVLGVPFTELETEGFHLKNHTYNRMHLAKGLEFRTVLIMA